MYYTHDAIPEWKDHVLMTSLKNKRLYDLELDENGIAVINETQYFTNWWGRLRDILVGSQGEIYLATSGSSWSNTEPFTHSIVKIWNPEYVNISESEVNSSGVSIFPNPAKDKIKLTVDSQYIGMTCQIMSIDSAIFFEKTIDNTFTEISTTSIPNGIYIYRLMNQNKIHYSGKIIVHNK